jgi:hypothetical protein
MLLVSYYKKSKDRRKKDVIEYFRKHCGGSIGCSSDFLDNQMF